MCMLRLVCVFARKNNIAACVLAVDQIARGTTEDGLVVFFLFIFCFVVAIYVT